MDVSEISNNLNIVNQYSNNVIEKNNEVDTIELSSIPDANDEQNNKKDTVNKLNDNNDLDKAINTLNKFLEKDKTHAEYSVYKDLGRTVIKIVDDETDEVVMELPQEKILDMVASMLKNVGILDEKA